MTPNLKGRNIEHEGFFTFLSTWLMRSNLASRNPTIPSDWTFLLSAVLCVSIFLVFSAIPSSALTDQPLVVLATFDGVINPVAAEYLHEAIQFAEEHQAELLVFQLDTPGGLDTSMRIMVKDITGSRVPVAVYIAPSGGRAASAGVFLTLAAHVAAMAPGTNIGAAHPVAMGGGEMNKVMKEKVENDAVAYIRSIAERHGRNEDWAEKAVRKSVSATANQALELDLIEFVPNSVEQLLNDLDGHEISGDANPIVLHTANAHIQEFAMSWRLTTLKALSDPNIAYVLMSIGMIGLIAELYNPGAILPGIVGAVSLILAFYSLQTLPVNFAGVLLLLLGIVLLILEVTVTSYGLLAIGGVTSLTLGSLMLMKSEFPFYQLSWSVIVPVVLLASGFTLLVVTYGVKSLKKRSITGSEGMIGLIGQAKTDLSPQGKIFVHGELWDAVSDVNLPAGSQIEVTAMKGLTLHVKPTQPLQKEA